MKRIILLISALLLAGGVCFSQSEADLEAVDKLARKFNDHARAFNEFARAFLANREEPEITVASGLYEIANKYFGSSDFLSDEFEILFRLENNNMKVVVQPVVARRVKWVLAGFDVDFKAIDSYLPRSSKPATVAQANKLKDDLKQFQELLQKISEKLPKVDETKREQK